VPAGLTIGGLLDQKANGLSSGYPTRFGPRERVEQVWRHLSARVADLVVADLDEVYRKREDAYRHSLLAERHVQRLKRLQTHTAAPIVCTTPRPDQALSVATRIAVLRDGVMQQIAAPEYVLQHPANDFVAGLMDSIPGTQTVQGEEGTG
jgi:ABC-type sugar transport system ATPase subunit